MDDFSDECKFDSKLQVTCINRIANEKGQSGPISTDVAGKCNRVEPLTAWRAIVFASFANRVKAEISVKCFGGITSSHFEKQSTGAATGGADPKVFKELAAKSLSSIFRVYGKKKKFFFFKAGARQEKTGCRFGLGRCVTSCTQEMIMAVAELQRVFDLAAVPCFAVDRVERRGHDRHDPVDIVDHATPAGNLASGPRPYSG